MDVTMHEDALMKLIHTNNDTIDMKRKDAMKPCGILKPL